MNFITLVIISYLLGSIPFGYLISRAKGIDIKKIGSGNIGGTNVGRALGKKYAIIVILLDMLKGFLPTLIATQYVSSESNVLIIGLAAIVGHIFPIFLKFKGGKGIATTAGVTLAIIPIWYIIVILLTWLILIKLTKTMSFSNLISSLLLPAYFIFIKFHTYILLLCVVILILLFWAHRENIDRLRKGEERKVNF
ncbi:MAG TPA: glycerol-3-phosphate 1-O-acyltransferase PlsY [Candidatus Nitrosocosmicus sp.]|nr:glycerol-3-phosphate 1-O-acyltransferase PlsY [Candidatus Nitrosocosmicus sp.]